MQRYKIYLLISHCNFQLFYFFINIFFMIMNNTLFAVAMAISVSAISCSPQGNNESISSAIIGRPEVHIPNGIMTPEVLYSLSRVSEAKL